jgi:hypothetical protein
VVVAWYFHKPVRGFFGQESWATGQMKDIIRLLFANQ